MVAKKKSFCIVCIANYCRSPVAENYLRKCHENKYEFFSAGISPLQQPNMDPRSVKFLKENDVKYSFHNPKKINAKMLSYFDKFLAVDFYVLNQLNINYPKFRYKFSLLTSQFSGVSIRDPYMLDDQQYLEIMNNIKFVSENIDLEEML